MYYQNYSFFPFLVSRYRLDKLILVVQTAFLRCAFIDISKHVYVFIYRTSNGMTPIITANSS